MTLLASETHFSIHLLCRHALNICFFWGNGPDILFCFYKRRMKDKLNSSFFPLNSGKLAMEQEKYRKETTMQTPLSTQPQTLNGTFKIISYVIYCDFRAYKTQKILTFWLNSSHKACLFFMRQYAPVLGLYETSTSFPWEEFALSIMNITL